MLLKYFKNKKIIVTGHTGFKGSWLSFWLYLNGAKVIGISNSLDKESNFKALRLERKLINKKIDVRNLIKFKKVIQKSKPDFIFHLAAQSLVKRSYNQPIETFNTNSIGTLNLLESLKNLTKKCTVVIITSDKSYKNLELKEDIRKTIYLVLIRIALQKQAQN